MLVPALLVLALIATACLMGTVTRRPTGLPPDADRGLRHERRVHAAALAGAGAAALVAGLAAMDHPLVRGELAVPLAVTFGAGIGYLGVTAVGQLAWPRAAVGRLRRAALVTRDVSDVAGRRTRRQVGLPLAVLVLAVAAPALLAPLDGPSAGSRAVYRAAWDEPPSAVVTVRDALGLGWPGPRYGLPALLAAGVLIVLAWLALRAVADRATVTGAGAGWDAAARAAAGRRVVAVTAGVLTVAGGWLVLAAGSRLVETGAGATVPVGGVLLVAGTLWAGVGLVSAVVEVLRPVGAEPRGRAGAGTRA
ncbi:hypothetical protein [Blastococcus sp. SYSU D00695]